MPRKNDGSTQYFRYRRTEKDGELTHHLDLLKSNGVTAVTMQQGLETFMLLEWFLATIGTPNDISKLREMKRLYEEQEFKINTNMQPLMTLEETEKFLDKEEYVAFVQGREVDENKGQALALAYLDYQDQEMKVLKKS